MAMQERNFIIQERNALALQLQQEYERAERQDTYNHCTICWFQMVIKFRMLSMMAFLLKVNNFEYTNIQFV